MVIRLHLTACERRLDALRWVGRWEDRVSLDEGFWASFREHPVPVREEDVFALGIRSMAMDVYIRLAYRLHALTKPTPVTCAAVQRQFAAEYKDARFIGSIDSWQM